MAGAVILVVEVERARIERKIKEGYCDYIVETVDEAIALVNKLRDQNEPHPLALLVTVLMLIVSC